MGKLAPRGSHSMLAPQPNPTPHATTMVMLNWNHGTTADEARDALRAVFERLGYQDQVKWNGHELEASVPLFLEVKGRITSEAIVLDKCAGLASGVFLSKCREMLATLFPGGASVP